MFISDTVFSNRHTGPPVLQSALCTVASNNNVTSHNAVIFTTDLAVHAQYSTVGAYTSLTDVTQRCRSLNDGRSAFRFAIRFTKS